MPQPCAHLILRVLRSSSFRIACPHHCERLRSRACVAGIRVDANKDDVASAEMGVVTAEGATGVVTAKVAGMMALETHRDGNCLFDAVLASKQAAGDAVFVGCARYVRGMDVELRFEMLEFVEKHAYAVFEDTFPHVRVVEESFAQMIQLLFKCSVDEYVERGRKMQMLDDASIMFSSLDTVMIIALAIVDGSTYAVHCADRGQEICRVPVLSARATTRVLFQQPPSSSGRISASTCGHFFGVDLSGASETSALPRRSLPMVRGGGLSNDGRCNGDELPHDWDESYFDSLSTDEEDHEPIEDDPIAALFEQLHVKPSVYYKAQRYLLPLRGGGGSAEDADTRATRAGKRKAHVATASSSRPLNTRRQQRVDQDVDRDEERELRRLERGGSPPVDRQEDLSAVAMTPSAPVPPSRPPSSAEPTQTAVDTRLTTVDVKDLHPYLLTRNKQLLVRLTDAQQKPYDNERGTGTVSSLIVADRTSDVQITFFNQPGLFERLRVGVVYYVPLAQSQIKPANKFNKARLPFEIALGRDAAIRSAAAACATQLPMHAYDFVDVAALAKIEAGKRVDVLAVVTSLSAPSAYLRKKDGRRGFKRSLEVCDALLSNGAPCGVRVTLFANEDESRDLAVGTIVALRGSVELWHGAISLTVYSDGIVCDPKIPEAGPLAERWRTQLEEPRLLASRWNFVGMHELPGKPIGARVDVVGVVTAVEVCCSACCRALKPPHCRGQQHLPPRLTGWVPRMLSPQPPRDYTRKSDGRDGTRQVVDLTDASQKSVRATIFMKDGERLELAVGMAVALRATTELWQHCVALKAFYDGVTCDGVSEAEALAERFRREPWTATRVEPGLHVVGFTALLDKAVDERVDVRGVISALEVHARIEGLECFRVSQC